MDAAGTVYRDRSETKTVIFPDVLKPERSETETVIFPDVLNP